MKSSARSSSAGSFCVRSSPVRRFFLIVASWALLFAWLTTPASAQRQTLRSQVAAPANAQVIRRLSGSQRLNLAIALPLRNQDHLDALLQQLYDPASANYRRFLTVQQFTEQFGPTVVDYQRVIGFAQAHGLKVTHTFTNRQVVDVTGSVANIERTFHVTMRVYQHPTENRTFYAPDVEPTIESALPVLSIVGLSTFTLPHPMLKRALPNAGVHSEETGSGPGGQFLGSDMRTAYTGGSALDGSGQVVGLIELGPYRLSDVLSYFTSLSQPLNVPIANVLVGVDGVCGVGCDDGEEVIDIQQAISMAPNLSGLLVYETNGPSTDALSAYAQAASDNIAKQLSISFGWGDTPGTTTGQAYEQVFQELEAQGTSSFVASGDAGASLSGGYPGNSPNITDAGGTDLTTGTGQAWSSEMGWIGSGGGWNTQSPIPATPASSWNQGPAINASNGGDPSFRNIPDVSAEANTDNYFCANGSCQGGIGGTSLAAPRWAAFVALINQQAAANAGSTGNPTLGFLNPTIYTLSSGDYASDFHDITAGNNATTTTCVTGTLGCLPSGVEGFDAVTGFDLVTGWGSPNGPTVFDALFPVTTNANFSMAASPATLSLTPGGQKTTSISVSALHGFSATTNLSVVVPGTGTPTYAPTGLTAGLSASSVAAGGGPVTLTVSTTTATPGGTYVIAVVGTSGSLTQTAYVTVELPAFVGLSATPAGGVSLSQGGTASGTVAITTINGFNGTVTLAATGLPSGVTASFSSVNATTSGVTFSASATAALTGPGKPAAVTITGTSPGSASQATGINLFVNPAASGGSGTAVDLSSAYNVYAFYQDGQESTITATNSLDGVGYAFSANLLGSGVDFHGTQFTFGPANQADAVYGTGSSISLPTGAYTTLQLLATGIQGNQASQPITVTYTDSTTSQFTQSFSDWCSALNSGCSSTGNNTGESVAVAMPYRDSAGGADNRVFYLYGYSFPLNVNKVVQSVTLPSNRNVVVLAVTLAGPVSTGYTLAATGPVSVPQGGNNTSTITVTPTGGFSGAVSLAASGLPAGVTASFNPANTSTTSTLTLTASASATTGTASVTVTGTSGSLTQSATVNVTITAPASYSLTAGAPTQATISPGSSSQAMVTVASANGYTGSVTLACSIAPVVSPAPTCSFGSTSPVAVTSSGGSATVTFSTVGPSAALAHPGTIYAMLLPIFGLTLIGAGFGSRDSRTKRLLGFLLLGIVVAGLIVVPACGGNGNNGGGGGGSSGTPAGSYTITVTGKDAGGTAQTNTAPTVTFTVN
jgi:subtilase family serine protease